MRYELECGHCGYQFVLDVVALPRTVNCTVCGGALTLAVPVPIAPKPAPPKPVPKPRPPVLPPPVVPPAPRPPVVDPWEPERASRLVEPWPLIRNWLNAGRITTDLGRFLYAVFLCADLFVCPGERTAGGVIVRALAVLGAAVLIPAIFHLGSQIILASTPRAHGGVLAHISAGLFVLALILTMFGIVGGERVAVAVAALVAFISFGFWLAFLGRLGRCLGDDALADAARAYFLWFPFGLVLLATFLTLAMVAASVPSPPLIWFGRVAVGVLGFVLLRYYAALLHTAVRSIDRFAPATPER